MRSLWTLIIAVTTAAVLAGCSSQASSNEANDYAGTQKDVVTVVDDLVNNASKKDGKEICTTVLARDLADKLKRGAKNCADAVDDQLADASNYDLKVTKVTVTGDTAQVVTKSDFDGDSTVRTLSLSKQDNDWRITGIDSP